MRLNAFVVDAQVQKLPRYDAQTGRDVSDYVVEVQAFDCDCMPQRYVCQIVEGFSRLDELKGLKQQGAGLEETERVVGGLRSELPGWFPSGPLRLSATRVQLDVLSVKYEMAGLYGEEVVVKLVCHLVVEL